MLALDNRRTTIFLHLSFLWNTYKVQSLPTRRCFLWLWLRDLHSCSVPCRWHRRSVRHLPGELLAQTSIGLGWSISILSCLSLSPTSSPSLECISAYYANRSSSLSLDAMLECALRLGWSTCYVTCPNMVLKWSWSPSCGIPLVGWAQLSNFIFRLKKTKTDQWMVILIVIPNSYQNTLPTR